MGTPDTAAGMRAFCASVIEPPDRFRDGLQIALDALGDSREDKYRERILLALHYLHGRERQDVYAWWAHQLATAAAGYTEFVGDADAGNSDELFDLARETEA